MLNNTYVEDTLAAAMAAGVIPSTHFSLFHNPEHPERPWVAYAGHKYPRMAFDIDMAQVCSWTAVTPEEAVADLLDKLINSV